MKEIKINLSKELAHIKSFKDYSKGTMYVNANYQGGQTKTYKILINDKNIFKNIGEEFKND